MLFAIPVISTCALFLRLSTGKNDLSDNSQNFCIESEVHGFQDYKLVPI